MSAALLELQALLPSVKEARNVALIQAAVSYTHLTLPTIYSV